MKTGKANEKDGDMVGKGKHKGRRKGKEHTNEK